MALPMLSGNIGGHASLPMGSMEPSMPAAGTRGGLTSTLDEPVSETLMRDLRLIGFKLKHVLMPGNDEETTLSQLKQWDLWGPLLVGLSLSIMLSMMAAENQTALVFAAVFVVIWVGAAIVTLNAQLLGGTISFFQSVCVLGYCVFPMNVVVLLNFIIDNLIVRSFVLRTIVVAAGFVWSTRASVVFMAQMVPPKRKALAVYPVLLFYIFIAWLILVS